MRMVVQLRDPNFTTKTTGESVLNTVPAISQPTTTTTTTTTSISPTVPPSIPREGDRMTQETESAITDLFRETVSKPITKQTETIVSNLSELAVKIVETPTAEEKPKFNEEQLAFIARVNQGVANTAVLPGVVSPEPAIAPVREGEQLLEESQSLISGVFREVIAGSVDNDTEKLVQNVVENAIKNTTTSTTSTTTSTTTVIPRPGDDDLGDEGDTNFIPSVVNNTPTIAVNDIKVNNSVTEDNVDITVEISISFIS